jgi:hypothetical protein
MRITSAGNVGIGITPSAWYTGYTALQVGFSGSIFSNRTSADTNTTMIGNNAFLNSAATNWIYQNDGFATRYTQVSGGHEFYTAASGTAGNAITWGTAKMTITSGGNVGIGTSSPNYTLHIDSNTSTTRFQITNSTTGQASAVGFQLLQIANDSILTNRSNGYMSFETIGNERMRITSGGNVLMGASSRFESCYVGIATDLAPNNGVVIKNTNAGNSGSYMLFANSAGATAGYIQQTGSTTTLYVATSDYRYKENIKPIINGLDRVLKINAVTYNWKDTNDEVGEGFIAHELQEIVPLAVSGEKDAINEDGTIKAQGIDYAKLTPILVAAIQEQQAQIEELKQLIKNK